MSNVTKLQQPLGKRLYAWLKRSRKRGDGLGWFATLMVIVAMTEEMRGHTDKATYILGLAIVLLLLAQQQNRS